MIDVHRATQGQLTGWVGSGAGRVRFTGTLELLAAIEAAVAETDEVADAPDAKAER